MGQREEAEVVDEIALEAGQGQLLEQEAAVYSRVC